MPHSPTPSGRCTNELYSGTNIRPLTQLVSASSPLSIHSMHLCQQHSIKMSCACRWPRYHLFFTHAFAYVTSATFHMRMGSSPAVCETLLTCTLQHGNRQTRLQRHTQTCTRVCTSPAMCETLLMCTLQHCNCDGGADGSDVIQLWVHATAFEVLCMCVWA